MKWLGLLVLLLSPSIFGIPHVDVAYLENFFKHNPSHHDVVVGGRVLARGDHQFFWEEFYNAVHYIASSYKRPILFVDVMPAYGYCSFKLLQESDAIGLLLVQDHEYSDGVNTSSILQNLALAHGVEDRVMIFDQSFNDIGVRYLAECEHCDVVAIANLLELCGDQWKSIYPRLFALGEKIVIGIANDHVCPALYQEACNHFDALDGVRLKTITWDKYEARFYAFFQKKDSVKKCALNDLKPHPPHSIYSTFYKKNFVKDGVERPWYNGINLITFRALRGIVPSEDYILDQLEALAPFAPKGANTIIEGKKLLVLP